MPTYEYECEKCGHHFEKFQPITTAPLTVCPENLCARKRWGKGKVTRAISTGGGLIFKGSGFYTTDYRSEAYKAAAKNDTGSTATTDSGAKNDAGKPSTSAAAEPAKAAPAVPAAKPEKAKSV